MSESICAYPFIKSGLDNVSIENTTVYNCSCGVSFPSIYRIPLLNDKIAETLLQKPSLLSGKEIRFLRKRLFLSLKSFSEILGIGNTTLSKWENDYQQHSEPNDRLIRETYIIRKGLSNWKAKQIIKYLSNIKLEKPIAEYVIVAEKIKDTYSINLKQISGTQAYESSLACFAVEIFIAARTKPSWTYPNTLGLDINRPTLTHSKNETKTTPYAHPY
jgi:DNA-binding transcriptional regulator YiaG